ncbi:hypothetical protein SAMN05216464_11321 [Mucilaginibacter pineti]|uniref:Uncharacterized protein n=1 Tax=Mucilaginibacter pineti TaxID=1391627 RepID=A0A1G7IGA8_9SPHI|nr:hypothetical protein [Mucilaginibacter pineti]SDF11780.1 hypothetical protein SAMN05216464_11321 [Mucilaginibacter pineti]
MSGIKSLADELREKIRSETAGKTPPPDQAKDPPAAGRKAGRKSVPGGIAEEQATKFFNAIESFSYNGTEKSLIRVDTKTMNLLKRIKLAKGIDMNRFIVYSLHHLISQHPWLAAHIQETLKNTDL